MDSLDVRGYYRKERKKNTIGLISTGTLLTAIISINILGVCSNKKDKIKENSIVTKTELQNTINEDVAKDSIKMLEEGKHILSVRVVCDGEDYSIDGYAIDNIPEGYEVFDIVPFTIVENYGSSTVGYDIWFKNTEPVEVESSYNEVYKNYGYYTFGKVVEKEKVLEK